MLTISNVPNEGEKMENQEVMTDDDRVVSVDNLEIIDDQAYQVNYYGNDYASRWEQRVKLPNGDIGRLRYWFTDDDHVSAGADPDDPEAEWDADNLPWDTCHRDIEIEEYYEEPEPPSALDQAADAAGIHDGLMTRRALWELADKMLPENPVVEDYDRVIAEFKQRGRADFESEYQNED